MKKFLTFLCAVTLVLGLVGTASANLITNGDFNADLNGWTTNGDVRIANTAGISGPFAIAQGMDGKYALLGLKNTDGKSTLRQDFDVTGLDKLAISFNWAFDYWDNSASADDTFLSFVRQDGRPAHKITLIDLETKGTSFRNPDNGMAYGSYNEVIDISGYTTDDARLIFRLMEESDSYYWTGTASVAGIDNVNVTAAPVPEPSTILLMGIGLLGLVGYSRKRSKKN